MGGFFGEQESVYDSPAERRKKQLAAAYANLKSNAFRVKEAFRSVGQQTVNYLEPKVVQGVKVAGQIGSNVYEDVYAPRGKSIFSGRSSKSKKNNPTKAQRDPLYFFNLITGRRK